MPQQVLFRHQFTFLQCRFVLYNRYTSFEIHVGSRRSIAFPAYIFPSSFSKPHGTHFDYVHVSGDDATESGRQSSRWKMPSADLAAGCPVCWNQSFVCWSVRSVALLRIPISWSFDIASIVLLSMDFFHHFCRHPTLSAVAQIVVSIFQLVPTQKLIQAQVQFMRLLV
jgi:hypothetical protein